jgi:hypothetical protein
MTINQALSKAVHSGDKQTTAGVETQYAVTVKEGYVWLSIQGSIQKEDWQSNFDFLAVPYRHQPVLWLAHRGFVKRWKQAREQIVAEVTSAIDSSKLPLNITGYSHGAAIATMAHEDFVFMGYDPHTVVFGSPRVLWLPSKKIRERFTNLTRVANRGDLVTMVPFWLLGFRHVGKLVKLGKFHLPWYTPHLIPEYSKNIGALA